MTVDEWSLRDVARDLAGLYRELDEAKHRPLQPRGERVMRPRPGPKAPGNWLAISRDAELVDHLVEMVCDARNYVQPGYCVGRDGRVLCNWIAFNAAAVADLDFANDLHDLMQEQAHKINRWLHPADINQVATQDPYLTAGSIQKSLTAKGLQCPEGTIRRWASERKVQTKQRRDGRVAYRLADIITRLDQR